MGNNPSVAQFKTDMKQFANHLGHDFHERILLQADELIGNMKAAAPVDTGTLRDTIRKVDVSRGSKYSVLVRAGGKRTTRATDKGTIYDYSLGKEFGTQKQSAEPFFYNSYRLYSRLGLDQYKRTLEQAVDENNKLRAGRASNYSSSTTPGRGGTATITHGRSGGAVNVRGGR